MENKTKKFQGGMTLVEIMVAMAILIIILSFGLIFSMDSYRAYSFRSDVSILISTLQRARSRSMSNMYQTVHGVCFDSTAKNYIIFRDSYSTSPSHESVSINPNMVVSPVNFGCTTGTGVIFSQLSGTTTGMTINVTDGLRSENIIINNEGTISW